MESSKTTEYKVDTVLNRTLHENINDNTSILAFKHIL